MIFLKVMNPSFPGHKHTEIRSNVEFQGIRITPNVYIIDVPFDFESELAAATWKELQDVGAIPVVRLPTLVQLKRATNREQDRIDLENLRLLYPGQIN
jgi:hypothetical protein